MQTRSAKSFRWRVYAPLALTSLVGFVAMVCTPKGAEWWWATGMAAAVTVAVVVTIRRMRSFRCPSCGVSIPASVETHDKAGAPIDYYCTKCDIRWETGLRTSDD
jgi:hypothetical protein